MTQAQRSAPAAGYATDAKAEYREAIWKKFRQLARTNLKYCKVLIMPSAEGIEIEVAERFGCQRQNIVAVDYNVAIAATLSRKYPGITAWGMDVFDAPARAAKEGFQFDVLHLDLTSNLSPDVVRGLRSIQEHIGPTSVVALNVMKGRELKSWSADWGESRIHRAITTNPIRINAFEAKHIRSKIRVLNSKQMPKRRDHNPAGECFDGPNSCAGRRSLSVGEVLGWVQLGCDETYVSGRVPMMWSLWRKGKSNA